MRRLLLSAMLIVSVCLLARPASAQSLTPTDLDTVDLGSQVSPDLTSNIRKVSIPSQSVGTVVASVWLKDGVYTYKFAVTPTVATSSFAAGFNVVGFDPATSKAGWSYSGAVASGVANPATAFDLTWTLHNQTDWLLSWEVTSPFWSAGKTFTLFFQSSYGPQQNRYNLVGQSNGVVQTYAPTSISLALNYNGKLRDRVGPGNLALAPDGAMDGTLTVTMSAAGGRTINGLSLQGSPSATWDTDQATTGSVLGVASTLDGALLNNATTMAVSFPVADGGTFRLFASDFADVDFSPGTVLTLTATFTDGTVYTLDTVVVNTGSSPASLSVAYNGKLRDRVGQGNVALAADSALDGTFTVSLSATGGRTITHLQLQSSAPGLWDTDDGTGFWALGVALSIDGALVNDPTTMAVNFAVADGGTFRLFASDFAGVQFVPGATLTVTADFSDGTQAAAAVVVPGAGPQVLSFTYDGKLRDRVAQGSLGLAADGALDGTFTVTLSAAGGRTIKELQLRSSAPGTWDTVGTTSAWALGVASTLDGPLLNNPGTMNVDFPVADGGTFRLFAADWADVEFVPGTTLTLSATFSDGTTATAAIVATAIAPPSLALTYDGKLRDRVGPGNLGFGADGMLDGTLTATLNAAGGRTVTRLELRSSAPGTWDTNSTTSAWVLGVATTLDTALLNDPGTMAVSFGVADGGSFRVFAADYANIEFVPGTTLTLTATFSDGTSATGTTVAAAGPAPPSLAVAYNGKMHDRVGPGNVGLGSDGVPEGVFSVTLSAAGGRTITRLQLQSSAPGTWDTDLATSAWILGVATTLGGALLNDPGTMAVNFAVADGGTFRLFAADWADLEFVPGTVLTVTATFSDGTKAIGSTVATAVAPPSLALAYNGKLRDRVGQSNLGLGADGTLDGTLTVTLSASGGRTITRLTLQSSAPGTWDTDPATSAWALGAASTLDGALLNDPGTMAVNFGVADGGSFVLFAADWANVEFVPGTTLTATTVFSDGTSARASVVVPSP